MQGGTATAIVVSRDGPWYLRARVTPPDGGGIPWETPAPLNLYHLMKALRARGCDAGAIRRAVEKCWPECKGQWMQLTIEQQGELFVARMEPMGGGDPAWASPGAMTEQGLVAWLEDRGEHPVDIYDAFDEMRRIREDKVDASGP